MSNRTTMRGPNIVSAPAVRFGDYRPSTGRQSIRYGYLVTQYRTGMFQTPIREEFVLARKAEIKSAGSNCLRVAK